MRASAQMISYEIAMGFVLVIVLMVSGSLNLSDIVHAQTKGYFASMGLNFLSWNWLPLLPMFVVYVISGIAETNRHPFDVVEGESEIVAGHIRCGPCLCDGGRTDGKSDRDDQHRHRTNSTEITHQ